MALKTEIKIKKKLVGEEKWLRYGCGMLFDCVVYVCWMHCVAQVGTYDDGDDTYSRARAVRSAMYQWPQLVAFQGGTPNEVE